MRDIVRGTDGAVLQSYEYKENGEKTTVNGSGPQSDKTWVGGLSVNDDVGDSGLYLMGHRHYDPSLGRFLSRDPIGFAGGLNLYRYASSSPVMRADPKGLQDLSPVVSPGPPVPGNPRDLSIWDIVDPYAVGWALDVVGQGEMMFGTAPLAAGAAGTANPGAFAFAGGPAGVLAGESASVAAMYAGSGMIGMGAGMRTMGQNMMAMAEDCSNPVTVTSQIKRHGALVKQANKIDPNSLVQKSIDALVRQATKGNLNPGLGTKSLFKGIFELRGDNVARVYFRHIDGGIEIIAKSTKDTQDKVISLLKKFY